MFFTSWPSKVQALIPTLTTVMTANGGPGRAQILLWSTPDIAQYYTVGAVKIYSINTVSIVSAKLGYTPLKDSNCIIGYPCIFIHAGSCLYRHTGQWPIMYAV